jgi:phosphomevalonate kinase
VISASAPGKVVLSGEYAVLAGAPALVLAVDRRVSLDLEIIDDNRWRFSSNGFSAQASHRLTDLTGTTRVAPSDPAAICQSILRTLAQTGVDLSGLPRGLNVSIDSRPLFYAGHKLGLGSSAAVTVVLTQGMLKLTKGGAEPFTAMLAAHRVLQGGRGSGVDVAAAFHGGLIRFERRAQANPEITRTVLAPHLHYRFFWSGTSASTPSFLQRFDEWRGDHPPPALTDLCAAADGVAQAAPNGAQFMRQLRAYTDRLAALDADAELGIFQGAHAKAFAAAVDDVVYKPCGAGGGDLGVAFSMDAVALTRFTRQLEDEGLESMPLTKDDHGIRISEK